MSVSANVDLKLDWDIQEDPARLAEILNGRVPD